MTKLSEEQERKQEIQLQSTEEVLPIKGSAFSNIKTFENAQRMAGALSKSSLVPKAYQNNVPNTMVAMEMAVRVGISPLMVMQNLDIIQGKPSWRSTFIIATLNSCGKFSPLRFKFTGNVGTDDYGCVAYAKDLETNEVITGPKISWLMVKTEGWLSKSGSKWKTMPELMFQYRAAAFFGRLYAPEFLAGMLSSDEVVDINKPNVMSNEERLKKIKLIFDNPDAEFNLTQADLDHIKHVIDTKEVLSYKKVLDALEKNLKKV